ncbi:MAG: 50S ribosomal protein L13 [Candidatus Dadabacteria bacterium]|nr:MAG: 50S ribosomal protein L13 [Candidatus Dadabacteria bacterium]
MKTKFLTKEEGLKGRRWFHIDATGKPLGRLAAEIASILRGKNKPAYTPHVDCGDFVVVTNASRIKLTGNKLKNKLYYRHTGYMGGLKVKTAGEILSKNPERLITMAVKGMLPKGPLGRAVLRKLKVYPGENHPHAAQKPESIECRYC